MGRRKTSEAAGLRSVSRASARSRISQPNESRQLSSSPARSTRRSTRISAVKNSSPQGSDMDSDDIDFGDSYMSGPSRKVTAVKVPTLSSLSKEIKRKASNTPSTVSSDFSNDRAEQMDFDTPGTSVAHTPAAIYTTHRPKKAAMGRLSKALEASSLPATSTSSTVKGKGKITAEQEQMEDDEAMAQALQTAEYETIEVETATNRKGKKRVIADSDEEEESELTDIESSGMSRDTSEFSDRPLAKKPKRSVAKKPHGGNLAKFSIGDTDASSALDEDEEEDIYSEDLSDMEDSEDESESADVLTHNSHSEAAMATTRPLPSRPSRTSRLSRRKMIGLNRTQKERAKLEHAHPEIVTLWEDLAAVPVIKGEQGPQPPYITRQLKSFQLEGVDWMRKQEKSKWKGGLLGDEMGMGKTIQAVSLIMSDYPAKDPTLVAVPPVALMQWSSEIAQYTDGKLKVLVHHNSDSKVKKMTVKDLRKYDVIMISYSGLESIYRKESKGFKREDGLVKENSRIHAIKYHRLILDEAHSIKSRTTGVAKACFALKADYKWCLSGTPVQNRIGEFFSLLRFLEVAPFASYFCKTCTCATLHWSQDSRKKCTHCGHSGFQHVSIFNQELLNPITTAEDPEVRKGAFAKLRLLTDRIMLRRVKRNHTASMELPPKEVVVHNEFFGPIEKDFSDSIMGNSNRKFDTYVSRGVVLNNYANIFGLLMQMRQVADHPDLLLRRHAEGGQNVLVCCICDEPAEEAIKSRCHHEFCRQCAKDYIRSFESDVLGSDASPDCPRCHIPLAIDFDQPDIEQDEDVVAKNSIVNRIKMDDWTSSTKIEMLIYDLYKLRSKKQTNKSIVFSQFTSCLDLIDWRLRRAGFSTVKLDGSMTPAQRQKSINYFMNNVDCEVFLVSLKAGGVALNLTEASRVFIVDPWWNPASEWQSADRAHRIGQRRPCVITRLCIEDSVESRIIALQAKKANMIAGTVDNDEVAMEKLSPEDMSFLFRGS